MTRIAPKSTLQNLSPYRPDVTRIPGGKMIRLSVNEGALGASPKVLESMRSVDGETLRRYPEQINAALVTALAERYQLEAARIMPSNGSDELIGLLANAYLEVGDEAIISQYGFLVFRQSVQIAGGVPIIAADDEVFTVSVDAMLAKITSRTRLIFLANPNNPTSTMITRAAIERLISKTPPHVIIVLDSAYAEYVDDDDYTDGAEYVDHYDNVVMLRTFSKIFALGGLRLGWGYLPPDIFAVLSAIRAPFSVNAVAAASGCTALGDRDFIRQSFEHNREWLPWIQASLRQAGFEVLPASANFFLISFTNAAQATAAYDFMLDRGIQLRRMIPYNLPHCLRMSVGTGDEMREVADAFKDLARQWAEG